MVRKKLRKLYATLVDSTLKTLVDASRSGVVLTVLRQAIRVRPFLHGVYQYRSGNMHRAASILKNWKPRDDYQRRLLARISEIRTVVDRGIAAGHSERAGKKLPFNNRVLLCLHNSLPYDHAGYATRSHHILKHLQHAGVDTLAATRLGYPRDLLQHADKPAAPENTIDGIRYIRLSDSSCSISAPDSEYIRGYGRALAALAQQHGSRIIHAASNFLNGMAAAEACRITGCTSVFEVRGLWHLTRAVKQPGFGGTDHFQYCDIMENAAAHEADAVVAISEALRSRLILAGIDERKIAVVPNAVEPDTFCPVPADTSLKRRLGLSGRTVIGYIGSVTAYEGLDVLMRAVSWLIDRKAELSLLIVGDGYAAGRLKKLAASLPHSRHIVFTGHVPFREIRRYYSIIDIFPFPRRDCDVCRYVPPLKILEVMAMAKPLIVSDVPALLESVRDGETGLVCKADDRRSLQEALMRLYESPGLRQQLGLSAQAWVQQHRSWETVVKRYISLYNDLGRPAAARTAAQPNPEHTR